MAGSGELYRRSDNRWAFRVFSSNGEQVADDASQGYENKSDARDVLQTLMSGGYDGPIREV